MREGGRGEGGRGEGGRGEGGRDEGDRGEGGRGEREGREGEVRDGGEGGICSITDVNGDCYKRGHYIQGGAWSVHICSVVEYNGL